MFSSSDNDSLSLQQTSDENSSFPSYVFCYMSRPYSFIIMALYLTKVIVVLPLSIIILHHGFKEWRQRLSTSSAAATGHTDTFTYNLVLMELFGVLGLILFCCGIYIIDFTQVIYGLILTQFIWYGEIFFHVLTCVEQYLAVVHPFIYLSLKNERGVRIKNISAGCVWLLCFTEIALIMTFDPITFVIDFCVLIFSLLVISFCSLSVLCVLVHPVPGDQGESTERVDQSKKRAFCIILVVLSLLLLRFTWDLAGIILSVAGESGSCVTMICGFWIYLPNSLVLPLLFLQRTNKLFCFKKNVG